MTVFLDTDVLIDCLRGSAPAQEWLEQHASESFQVPGIVAMELLAGCRNQADRKDKLRAVEFTLDLGEPELWVLPFAGGVEGRLLLEE